VRWVWCYGQGPHGRRAFKGRLRIMKAVSGAAVLEKGDGNRGRTGEGERDGQGRGQEKKDKRKRKEGTQGRDREVGDSHSLFVCRRSIIHSRAPGVER